LEPGGLDPAVNQNKMITNLRSRATKRSRRCSSTAVGILFINVTAGIGILAQASPMMQDMFKRPRCKPRPWFR